MSRERSRLKQYVGELAEVIAILLLPAVLICQFLVMVHAWANQEDNDDGDVQEQPVGEDN